MKYTMLFQGYMRWKMIKALLNQSFTSFAAWSDGWIRNIWSVIMTATNEEDNWLKIALGIGASLVGSALIAFIIYAVPKLNQISESQATIMTTLNNQSHWQTIQDDINKTQADTNQKFSVDIAQLQTAMGLGKPKPYHLSDGH
jgi:hypothetical protein